MCWKTKEIPVKQIAEEDIPVFKIVLQENSTAFRSIYKNYKYYKNKTYFSDIGKVKRCYGGRYIIHEGFHSYSNECEIVLKELYYPPIDSTDINLFIYNNIYCLDAFPLTEDGKMVNKMVKLNCVIPKNAKYYINEYGEYVSNQIKVIDFEYLEECAG